MSNYFKNLHSNISRRKNIRSAWRKDYEKLEDRQLLAGDVAGAALDGAWSSLLPETVDSMSGASYLDVAQDNINFLDLQEESIQKTLSEAPLEFTPGFVENAVTLSLPRPDGTYELFSVVEAPVFEEGFSEQFPDIKTYRGWAIDDPTTKVRLDTTHQGFHAQVMTIDEGRWYIDPYFHNQESVYASYFARDLQANKTLQWTELALDHDHDGDGVPDHLPTEHSLDSANIRLDGELDEDGGTCPTCSGSGCANCVTVSNRDGGTDIEDPIDPNGPQLAAPFGDQLRTYSTVIAATGEYSQFHGGTQAQSQSAIVTALNRVTGVYENDLSIRMVLVANNSNVVYTNPNSDPYSNNNGSAMLSQNQGAVDAIIGSANYDIGHVFSTGGGGIAGLGVVGLNGQKARGVTGSPAPTGDAFWIDYVAHEMGHQFDGDHTFNDCGGGNGPEFGSGSTIQAYAGICGSTNLQSNSDAMFHSYSIDEIRSYVTSGVGNSSATITNTANNIPTVNAGSNYTIPDQTPFELTAVGSDADAGDVLTYSWEQRDTTNVMWRAFLPTQDETRTFPRLTDVLNNNNNPSIYGEILPSGTFNNLDFTVTVRDNSVLSGGVASDAMQVDIVNSGTGFRVTSQTSTSTTWTGNATETITWNVSGTSTGQINTPNVDIFMSTDGGMTFDTTLATAVPNDGSHDITVPDGFTSSDVRIKIKGSGNIFFDINDENFNIEVDPGGGGGGGGSCGNHYPAGALGFGVAVDDAATGTGYMMYSVESVHTRFSGINVNNADQFIATRLNGSQWQINDNNGWVNFTPVASDILVAELDFSADSVTSLAGTNSTIGGIMAGYSSGDIVITADMWNGSSNDGEFGVSGTTFSVGGGGTTYSAGNLGFGIAVDDAATGTGYMMYSDEVVHTRFTGINANNADHFIAVRLNGSQWQLNDNNSWVNFTPVATDILLAELDFSADSVTSLVGTSSTIGGVAAGYDSGDIVFTADMWNGSANDGEFGVTGTNFTVGGGATTYDAGALNFGIAVDDAATGTGYMMYSDESVHTRFTGINTNNADHFIAVRLNGSQWQLNDNNSWVNFTPVATDILLAELDFSADSVTSLVGTSSTIGGVAAGYDGGDIMFTADMWNGSANDGEFGVTGTNFTIGGGGTTYDAGALGRGIAVDDAATGTGYMMYSDTSVHTRFSGINSFNADHFLAVRLNGSQWQYNDNSTWVNFTADATDILIAELNFSADTATSLIGTSSTIGGMAAGYDSGDIVVIADQWNGSSNDGEFEVTGTNFVVGGGGGTTYSLGDLGRGVAAFDGATGDGYMLYTDETVHTRFNGINQFNADHFITVRLSGSQWQYNNNGPTTASWVNFTPVGSDILVAEIDFSADTVTLLSGTSTTVSGVASGYNTGDLTITANMWNGASDNGEFGVDGTTFTTC